MSVQSWLMISGIAYKESVNIERERRGHVTYPFRTKRPLVLKSLNINSLSSSLVCRLSRSLSLHKSSSSARNTDIVILFSSAL